MNERDLYFWVNIFVNCEVEIQPLLHLTITTLQGLHGYQKERVGVDKEFKAEKAMAMDLKEYKNLLTSGRWYIKDLKDDHILSLVGLDQKIAYESNKSSDKSNTSNM